MMVNNLAVGAVLEQPFGEIEKIEPRADLGVIIIHANGAEIRISPFAHLSVVHVNPKG